jgi:hypothetical protein
MDSDMGDNTDPGEVLDMARLETKDKVWTTGYTKVNSKFLSIDL